MTLKLCLKKSNASVNDLSHAPRIVPDTNIILASQRSHPNSPNAELIARWRRSEFALLISDDTLREYIEKLLELQISEAVIGELVRILLKLAERIELVSMDDYLLALHADLQSPCLHLA